MADKLNMEKAIKLTQYELETMDTRPAGMCELIANEEHFSRVIRDGMAKARISLDIMTADFKAMLVPLGRKGAKAKSVVELFRTLAARGVEIRIMHAGTPSGPALVALKKITAEETGAGAGRLTIRRCPRLHAKAVVIDSRVMYLGSANLTGAGLGAKGKEKRNFEMGIWTEAAGLIEGVMGQFNMLWEGDRCRKCRRKDVCPVPLEEPRL
ncbi:MAG TPA: phospholipase D-like domain-containing protein [Phycisphaerae bacterium]|jgi:phosphatidylserine/phosphatidylglycerophosphate/cardiolipin synthase-like enzyme